MALRQLSHKRIIVTGGASGIGAAAIRAYSSAGARVVSFDIAERVDVRGEHAPSEDTASTLLLRCDVSDREQVFSATQQALAHLGGIDCLLNCAGIAEHKPAEELTTDDVVRMFGVHFFGTLYTNQAVFPAMRDGGGGSIINVSSPAGVRGLAGATHYGAAKGAVLSWTRGLAIEWMPYNIRVNALAPSVWTPLYQATRDRLSPTALAAHDELNARTMLGGKLGDPDRDLAPFLVFLASDGAAYITGQTFPVNGGKLILT
jgi:NAD(P)-dependent dehydrogenase (short-subunit alcohol dehydrogenase family)